MSSSLSFGLCAVGMIIPTCQAGVIGIAVNTRVLWTGHRACGGEQMGNRIKEKCWDGGGAHRGP